MMCQNVLFIYFYRNNIYVSRIFFWLIFSKHWFNLVILSLKKLISDTIIWIFTRNKIIEIWICYCRKFKILYHYICYVFFQKLDTLYRNIEQKCYKASLYYLAEFWNSLYFKKLTKWLIYVQLQILIFKTQCNSKFSVK